MHLLEVQLQQYPVQQKNLQAERASLQRKEDEWKKEQLAEIEIAIGRKEKERQKCNDAEAVLKQEREKRIKEIDEVIKEDLD